MAKNNNLKDFLIDLANAIREKKGTTEPINPQNFSEEIRSIEGGGSIDSGNFSYTLYDDTWIGPKNYKTINVKEGVTVLKNLCFYNYTMVLSYTLPSTLKIIEASAFQNNFELQNIVIPENVQQLLDSCFIQCRTLTSINIPKSVTKILNAFRLCSSLSNITVDSENTVYDSRDNCNAIIETATNRIIDGGISTVIPESVVTIGRYSFSGRGPEIFKIPKNIQTIEVAAFDSNNITLEYNFSEHESIPTLVSDNAFKSITVDYKIVVPDDLYDQWIAATNWSSLASRIVKASDQYIEFADPIVAQLCAENWGDGTGITYNKAKDITEIVQQNGFLETEITSFNELELFENLETIGSYAFDSCYALTSIKIPNSVTSIGVGAFFNCSSLINIELPPNITSISQYMFWNCSSLVEINIPDNVSEIGTRTFLNCFSLRNITIPSNVTTIGQGAFWGSGSECLIVEEGNTVFDSRNNCNAIIETATNKLLFGSNNTIIPEGIVSIEFGAFTFQSRTIIDLPSSITTIGDYAFENNASLGTVISRAIVPPTLDANSFIGTNLGVIYVPDVSIDEYKSATNWSRYSDFIMPLSDYENLIYYTSINNTVIEPTIATAINAGLISNTYKDGAGVIKFNEAVTSIGQYAFRNNTNLESIIIPSSVTSFVGYSLEGCTGIESIKVNSGNTKYDSRENCNAIILTAENKLITGCKNTIIPSTVYRLGGSCFGYCTSLTEIVLPDTLLDIGGYSFRACSGLTKVTIGSGISSIGENAFYQCTRLSTVICKPTTPPVLGNTSVFDSNASDRLIYVPDDSVNAYKNATNWSAYADYIRSMSEYTEPITI